MFVFSHKLSFNDSIDLIKNQMVRELTPIQKIVAIIAITCLSLLVLNYFGCGNLFSRKVTVKNSDEQEDIEDLNVQEEGKGDINEKGDIKGDIEDWNDHDIESPIEISHDSTCIYESDKTKEAKKEVEQLLAYGDCEGAWSKYVQSVCDFPRELKRGVCLFSTFTWKYLPSEKFMLEFLSHLSGVDQISKRMPMAFLRDCLLVYPQLRQRFFLEDKLWNCFIGYPDYIAEICCVDKQFAKDVILSPRSKDIRGDSVRLEIFESAYPQIGKALQNRKIGIQEIKFLALFLLNYQLCIKKSILSKIENLRCLADKLRQDESESNDKTYEHCDGLLDLVISKLNNQGVYDDQGIDVSYPKIDLEEKTVYKFANSDQMEILIEEIILSRA